jgi:hypothetical protein
MPSAAPTPEGPYTVPLHRLAQMLAECAAFQTRCGLSYPDADAEAKLVNGDGGLKRIFYPAIEGDALELAPCAILTWGSDWQLPMSSGGARNYFHSPVGEIFLELIDVERHPGNEEASTRNFGNWIGLVLHSGDDAAPGLGELSALNDRLAINRFTQLEPPLFLERVDSEARGAGKGGLAARFAIQFGLGR